MPNAYTFAVVDSNNLVSAEIEAKITAGAQYVIGLLSGHVGWQGTLDFVVQIRPASESPYPNVNGILPSVVQVAWNGSAWINQTLDECLTGIDGNPNQPDAGCTIYLASDGSIRNYNAPVWFDPSPQSGVDPDIPAGQHDFIGIYTHEIFHSLGFIYYTQQWQDRIVTQGGISYFQGAASVALFGDEVPFAANTDHYGAGNASITRGLMYQYGNYEGNRWDLDRISLGILGDLGHSIKTYAGLSLFELIDSQLDLSGTSGNDNVYGDYHANTLYGLAGNDLLEGGGGNDTLVGGGGNDALSGGPGNDLHIVENAGDSVTEATGEGADIIYSAISYSLNDTYEVESLSTITWQLTDPLNLTGNGLANTLIGNAGANQLDGRIGADVMIGREGHDIYLVDNALDKIFENSAEGYDVIYTGVSFALTNDQELEGLSTISWEATVAIDLGGNSADNYLIGNAGANLLDGKAGNDVLHGKEGADTFQFTALLGPTNVDLILEFSSADDVIALDNNGIFTGLADGALPASAFVIGSAALDADDRIVYSQATGQLFFDADGSGAGAQVQFALLSGAPAITASDFIVI